MGQQRITLADIITVADRLGIYNNIHRYSDHSAELWCDESAERRVTFTFDGPVMTIERTDMRPVILDAFPDDGETPEEGAEFLLREYTRSHLQFPEDVYYAVGGCVWEPPKCYA
jgi:hypothetical protein